MRLLIQISVFVLLLLNSSASSISGERQFFKGIAGKWSGPGEIVAGKYKGTKFTCNFKGFSEQKSTGMKVDGSCRVGVFSQPMNAIIIKRAGRYSGKFLDGAAGEGMDVVGGRYTSARMVAKIKRKALTGTMVAHLDGDKRLNVTVSVKVQGQMVPVIGMTLKKIGAL